MRYYSVIVVDMVTDEVVEAVAHEYEGEWALCKPHQSGVEKQGLQDQQKLMNESTGNENTAQGTLSQFEGPVQSSPYYQSLMATGTDATTNAYQNAQESERANANQAGFGAGQPVGATADTALQAQEAGALGRLPAQSAQQASQAALTAAGQTAGIGESQGQQGLGYFGDATQLEEQYQNALNAFQNKLWNTGASAAGSIGDNIGSVPGAISGIFG